MFSLPEVRSLLDRFVLLKVDPRNPGAGAPASEWKSTRYVPEVVLLSPEGEVLDRIDESSELSADGARAVLTAALGKLSR